MFIFTITDLRWICFRPDLIEFHKLTRSNATHNLQQAFNIAEQSLGLTKLLDPEGRVYSSVYYTPLYIGIKYIEWCFAFSFYFLTINAFYLSDVNTENPDEKSIITYVVSYYHYFSKMKALIVEGKRIGKVRVFFPNNQGISIDLTSDRIEKVCVP